MKMKRSILACMAVAVVFGCSVASVRADDIYTPPWLRFVPTTTYQNWTFETSANPSQPDAGIYNIYGTPYATITGGTWMHDYEQHAGVWILGSGSTMDLAINNTPYDPERWKDLWTQITWRPNGNNEPPVVIVNGIQVTAQNTYPIGNNGWYLSVYETTLIPNPSFEDLVITGNYYLGEVVVDTICIPEPSSLGLLAVGAFSLLYASRKRRLAA